MGLLRAKSLAQIQVAYEEPTGSKCWILASPPLPSLLCPASRGRGNDHLLLQTGALETEPQNQKSVLEFGSDIPGSEDRRDGWAVRRNTCTLKIAASVIVFPNCRWKGLRWQELVSSLRLARKSGDFSHVSAALLV